jgi:hypothetical protein
MHTSEANRRAAAKTLVAVQNLRSHDQDGRVVTVFFCYCAGVKSAGRLQDPAK